MTKNIYESVFVNVLEYITDNGYTPCIAIDLSIQGVTVPVELGSKGSLVLNVSPSACSGMTYDMAGVTFQASFNGVPSSVFLPWNSITVIFPREDHTRSFIFAVAIGNFRPFEPVPPKKSKPKLTLVKG